MLGMRLMYVRKREWAGQKKEFLNVYGKEV